MDLTIGLLKKIIAEVPDEVILGALDYRDKIMDFSFLKRVLLLEKDNEKVLIFNAMGTHYFDLIEKDGYKVLKSWSENEM